MIDEDVYTTTLSFSVPLGDMRCPVCNREPGVGDTRVMIVSAGSAYAKSPPTVEDGDELFVVRSYCPEHEPDSNTERQPE